jgi:hypothetical protein
MQRQKQTTGSKRWWDGGRAIVASCGLAVVLCPSAFGSPDVGGVRSVIERGASADCGRDSNGCGTFGEGWWEGVCDAGAYPGWEVVDGAWVQCEPLATIGRYEVLELTFHQPTAGLTNPWEDVSITATFAAPSGKTIVVGGFYYDADTYKTRFAPVELGAYSWSVKITSKTSERMESGGFLSIESPNRGFVRPNPGNPHQWILDDGTAYRAIGLGDCTNDWDGNGDPFDDWLGMDGFLRTDCPSPEQCGDRYADYETYMATYGGAEFNLFRWSIDNCSFKIWDRIETSGNRYLVKEGQYGDRLVQMLRKNGMRVYLVFFGFAPAFAGEIADGAQMQAVRRYLKYVVDRYGAYADFWELMNEATVTDFWIQNAVEYVRSIDPYGHRIATSWEKPQHPSIEIDAPHWYERENELHSDIAAFNSIRGRLVASGGKPVIHGEQGNSVQNWDERSGLRMRLRSWAALMAEGTLIFWNTSSVRDYKAGAANLYIGPEERGYIKTMQEFAARLPADMKVGATTTSDPTRVRGYALRSTTVFAAYYTNHRSHDEETAGVSANVDVPSAGTATWISPATGATLTATTVSAGQQALPMPTFVTDAALIITP